MIAHSIQFELIKIHQGLSQKEFFTIRFFSATKPLGKNFLGDDTKKFFLKKVSIPIDYKLQNVIFAVIFNWQGTR
jgi:hypothetical protein